MPVTCLLADPDSQVWTMIRRNLGTSPAEPEFATGKTSLQPSLVPVSEPAASDPKAEP